MSQQIAILLLPSKAFTFKYKIINIFKCLKQLRETYLLHIFNKFGKLDIICIKVKRAILCHLSSDDDFTVSRHGCLLSAACLMLQLVRYIWLLKDGLYWYSCSTLFVLIMFLIYILILAQCIYSGKLDTWKNISFCYFGMSAI